MQKIMLESLAMADYGDQKKRRGNLTNGMSVLQSLLEGGNNPLSDQFLRWKLWMQWSQYVGTSVAKNTLPVGYHHGRLYIWVKSSVWMHQLQFLKEALKDSINQRLGRMFVMDIVFTLDQHNVPKVESKEMKAMLEKIIPPQQDNE